MSQNERFKRYAGLILGKLEHSHPLRVHLSPSKLLIELNEEVNKESINFCYLTLEWLHENGYFRCGNIMAEVIGDIAENMFREARLTDKGFAALEVKIDFRGKVERIGDVLAEQASAAAGEARNAVMADLAGRALGGLFKSLSWG